jgi:hypothetical protein
MTKHVLRLTVAVGLAVAVVAMAPSAALAATQQQIDENTQLFTVSNVSLDSAYTLAFSVCRDAFSAWEQSAVGPDRDPRPRCDVEPLHNENMLAVTASPELRQRIAMLLGEFDRLPQTRSFHIVVLAASTSGTGSADLPGGVQTALDDVREFLPYSSFTTLGSGWLRTSRHGETTLPGGPDEFSAELMFRTSTDPSAPVLIEHFRIVRRVAVEQIVDGIRTVAFQNRGILESTFTISPGETVVVGTSKLNGDDEALVVLLTAVQN